MFARRTDKSSAAVGLVIVDCSESDVWEGSLRRRGSLSEYGKTCPSEQRAYGEDVV
jgi:hypothetical protein